jgi:pantoate--beta-alanine ligase
MRRPKVARTLKALDRATAEFATANVALVPTMGALHEGHLSLVRRARRHARRVIVSIFVNPAQFAPHEDLATYPRTWDADVAALAREEVDLIWAPSVGVMYPDGFATQVVPAGPAQAGLEDSFRPHFFAGVATVVAKLFLQCRPDFAIFGEKDFQQLKVVTRLARDFDLRLKVIGAPIVREPDGLAMSSRNAYLNAEERKAATVLSRALDTARNEMAAGVRDSLQLQTVLHRVLAAEKLARVDYAEVVDAETFEPVLRLSKPCFVVLAVFIGKTRLIDNLFIEPKTLGSDELLFHF